MSIANPKYVMLSVSKLKVVLLSVVLQSVMAPNKEVLPFGAEG